MEEVFNTNESVFEIFALESIGVAITSLAKIVLTEFGNVIV